MTAVSEQHQSNEGKGRSAEWTLLGDYSLRTMYFRIKESRHASKERDHVALMVVKVKKCMFLSLSYFHFIFLVLWFGLEWGLEGSSGFFVCLFSNSIFLNLLLWVHFTPVSSKSSFRSWYYQSEVTEVWLAVRPRKLSLLAVI